MRSKYIEMSDLACATCSTQIAVAFDVVLPTEKIRWPIRIAPVDRARQESPFT